MTNLQRWERIGRWFMAAGALFAVPSGLYALGSGLHPAELAAGFAFTVWSLLWVWLWLRVVGRNHDGELLAFVAITVLSTLFALIEPYPATTVLVFACVVAGVIFPARQAVIALAGLAALQVAVLLVRQADFTATLNVLINNIFVGLLAVGARFFWLRYIELITAREQLAHLAVTEERLRFARDLHDTLGQSLSVLVLKSELVSKQLPADTDDSVRHEVRDIAHVARRSLNDLRETAAGYRHATLQAEISSARTALRAAGIGLLVEDSLGALPPAQDGVLAWCLREAVTNVVKHSGAKRCEVHLTGDNGDARLEVSDDGRGATSLDGGNGLAGMRERVELVGGTLRVGSENGDGLRVHVSVPRVA